MRLFQDPPTVSIPCGGLPSESLSGPYVPVVRSFFLYSHSVDRREVLRMRNVKIRRDILVRDQIFKNCIGFDGKHGSFGMPDYLLGDAAHEDVGEPRPAVR